MKTKGQVALAVGAGYMLGRTHRMKMALMLAAAGATGRFPGGPRDLLERGTKVLANSPEFAKISDSVRQELVSAAKAAAVTAASQRINQLNNRILSGGGEAVSDVGDTVDDTVGGVGNSVGKLSSLGKLGRKRRGRSKDEEYDESEVDEEPDEQYAEEDEDYQEPEPDEDEASDEEEPARRKRPAARRRASSNGSSRPTSRSRSAKSDEDEEDDEEAPTRGRRTRAKATTDSAPVRRGGR
ncbi:MULTISPECIES: hypothetical protein [unclassified Rhodococcus (in: high G+C Gram-positive bacteria)]|uniref:hypothetical protein n=1 Tax=unclassified Rhodococcus (in: high G+C Gram-positive bacteria) TaxID=192944 RepID=UPI000B3C18C0|nr:MULTISPECIES: hypothetical protein [unclassified Rhodococcus (in: high G+C Gram-positive bacteria)]KAF0964370.1 hypothetical protein MLGJGCBP_02444 [Rhodococcus sp. T7]OUS95243.1 hypothetical protein CA951_14560 [Rhodococcus sp. NCIMB 12038]